MNPFHIQIVSQQDNDLGTDFNEVCARLEGHSEPAHSQVELDGSFVWRGDGWQVDGMLYDRANRLQFIELKGRCPLASWRALIAVLIGEAAVSAVRIPQGGLYDLQTFETLTWP